MGFRGDSRFERICLGTAQFGMDYGVANRTGKVPQEEVTRILKYAREKGLCRLDTAPAYGESESVLGAIGGEGFSIVTKMPRKTAGRDISPAGELQRSLNRLGRKKVAGYLLHHFEDFRQTPGLWDEFQELKRQGYTDKIGFSLYHVEEWQYLRERRIYPDVVQVPYNLFDRRFEDCFADLKALGVEVFTRSVFLQGLFFLQGELIRQRFPAAEATMNTLQAFSRELDLPIHVLCLGFVLMHPDVDAVVIGVDSLKHLEANLRTLDCLDKIREAYPALKKLELHEEEVILPTRWQ